MEGQVSVRSRFERFPATVKGAFIARGADRDPHQIIFEGATVTRIGDAEGMPIPMKIDILNVVPNQDLFLPFEFSTTDLAPGWHSLQIQLEVDGISETFDDGRRFVVAWPRGSVRRGSIATEDVMQVGDARVTLMGLECAAETSTLRFSVAPSEAGSSLAFSATVDAAPHPVMETSFEAAAETGTVVLFPILRVHRELIVTAKAGAATSEPVIIKLPG